MPPHRGERSPHKEEREAAVEDREVVAHAMISTSADSGEGRWRRSSEYREMKCRMWGERERECGKIDNLGTV
ncbi:hypothetical protein TIFTF001_012903 [Ficus carica]|uniref:Uncharacterized protein n=1 Tax=Ficus carica TaxID=3494 RepID=A0AA88D2D0_FICCA|nr:hypothetical protein TIFTF001_012903 [Ficus carica]